MNKLLKYRKILIIFFVILGLLIGFTIFNKLSDESKQFLYKSINSFKYMSAKKLLIDIIVLSISILLSISLLGIGILCIYLFLEFISIGFISSWLIFLYKFNGFIYLITYILIFKIINIFLFIILIIKYIKIGKNIFLYIKKQPTNITQTIINIFIINFIIIINDIFLLFFGNNMLNTFSFLLK